MQVTARDSAIWKRVLQSRTFVEKHLRWFIGKGQIDAYRDKWLDIQVPISDIQLKVRDLYFEDRLHDQLVKEQLGDDVYNEIIMKNIRLTPKSDKLIWIGTRSGKFILNSAWGLLRYRSMISYLHKNAWSKFIPQKISIFIWKVLHNVVPTDMVVKKRGVIMVSKCSCCILDPRIETTNHLLIVLEIATQVWQKMYNLMNVNPATSTIAQVLMYWWVVEGVSIIH